MKCPYSLALGLAAILAGCAAQGPVNEMASSSAAQPAAETQAPPPEKHEVAAQCWMKYDKSTANLDAKAKLVDKCIAERMKGKS
jgi:hypothetical protein